MHEAPRASQLNTTKLSPSTWWVSFGQSSDTLSKKHELGFSNKKKNIRLFEISASAAAVAPRRSST